MKSGTEKDIALKCAWMQVHTSMRILCPKCGGGDSKEVSMTVSRSREGLLYCCHRASCRFKGFISTNITELTPPQLVGPVRLPRSFTGLLTGLSDSQCRWFWNKFQLPSKVLDDEGVSYCDGVDRFLYPIRGPNGIKIGDMAYRHKEYSQMYSRIPVAEDYKKAILYIERDDVPIAAWYITDYSQDLVFLVEDQLSAMKLHSLGFNAIALIGTNISTQKIHQIGTYFKNICLMLDPDAVKVAREAVKNFNLFFEHCWEYKLLKDPKDTDREILRGICRDYVLRLQK